MPLVSLSNRRIYIIVLGHLMNEEGVLDDESLSRVAFAACLDKELSSQAVVLCGWDYRSDCCITIADSMRRYISVSHPDLFPKVLMQPLSRDTVGDAFFSRILLQNICEERAPEIVVVTSDYHVMRSAEIFGFIFNGYAKRVRVRGCKIPVDYHQKMKYELHSIQAFRDTFLDVQHGDVVAIHDALCVKHPYYNESVYPKIGPVDTIVDALCGLGLIT